MRRILLVGAGRRYSFVEKLLRQRYIVASYETDKFTPISKLCTIIEAEPDWDKARAHLRCIDDREFSKSVDSFPYDYILPMNDQATFELGGFRKVIGHSKSVAEICYDKSKFEKFMLEHFPEVYPSPSSNSNLIVKPRFGNSSKGVLEIPYNPLKLQYFSITNPNQVVQAKIVGTEYSVDAYFSKYGKYIGSVPRTRERVAGGEVIDSRTIDNKLLQGITEEIGTKLQMTGPACFQYMVDKDNHPYLFEINARFGGGCILSMAAGFDMLDMIGQEYWMEELNPYHGQIQWGMYMRRVNREIFFEG